VLGATLPRVRQLRPEAPGPERLDRFQEEEESDRRVEEHVEAEEGPQPDGQVVDDLGAGGEEEEGDVEGAHDDEGEAGLAVGQLHEVLGLLERVHEGPVALPGVEGAGGLRQELGFLPAPLRVVVALVGTAGRDRRRWPFLDHPGSIAGPRIPGRAAGPPLGSLRSIALRCLGPLPHRPLPLPPCDLR
jgi:hypothetical protein